MGFRGGRDVRVFYVSPKCALIWIPRAHRSGANLLHQEPDFIGADTIARHDRLNDRLAQEVFECRFASLHGAAPLWPQVLLGTVDDRPMSLR
jgi:hypothetical protein